MLGKVAYYAGVPKYQWCRAASTHSAKLEGVDAVQARYLEERCIEVTPEDEVVGSISKLDCHKTPILHRAFSVFIFNPKGELLLQKRSSAKVTFPNAWTNACCSHPLFTPDEMETGSNALGVRKAASRKLEHELGIKALDLNRMQVMGRFIYKAKSPSHEEASQQWWEHELDYAIVIPKFNSALKPNSEEVSEVKYVDRKGLAAMLKDTKLSFSPWFGLFAKFDWLEKWWHSLDNLEAVKEDLRTVHRLN